jgi:hypothetical protein
MRLPSSAGAFVPVVNTNAEGWDLQNELTEQYLHILEGIF